MTYIGSIPPKECIFCEFPTRGDDAATRILHRGERCFTIMNIFPYNPGHIMVVPFRHVADYDALCDEELLEMHRTVQQWLRVLRKTMAPQGFNMGINLGKVAGAGVAGHVHVHIVPRWNGDTNFMPVFGDVRVVPEALDVTYAKLKEGWDEEGVREEG
jgi:ATP adenylyltransferase